ncbi:MAG: GNAT family N-acetyltransferase [Actinomycetota bacterium]|nr:GNAT family N-acetyltransferase [Actinomycetota bacterium]
MLELTRGLPPETLTQIAVLELDSVSADGGRLKLEWSALESRAGDSVEDLLWWEDNRLVGFLGLYTFGGPNVELSGMVHPDFRRRGIGGKLLDEAIKLCRHQGRHKILLVIPRTSPGGRTLAESRRGFLDHSEHALDLDGEVAQGPLDPSLTLRAVTSNDLTDEARILAEAFGDSAGPMVLDALDESRLAAERDGRVIATIRVQRTPEQWGIYGFAVEPQLRGMGIGRDLLRRVCRLAHEAGVKRLHLEVEVNNDRALGLYTSLGFAQTSTEDYFDIPF